MSLIPTISEFFLLSLALGLALFSPLASSKLTGAGFLKVLHSICAGSLVISSVIHFVNYGASNLLPYAIACSSLVVSILFHEDRRSIVMWIMWATLICSTSYMFAGVSGLNSQAMFYGISSMLFMGSITYAMVLGHWYLVVPRLTEAPLKKALYFTWIVLAVKSAVACTIFMSDSEFLKPGTVIGSGYAFNWMMVLMRMLWGYVIIGVMSYFAYRLVAMRSIQSATGVLYVMTFFVFIGELIGSYLFYQYGVLL